MLMRSILGLILVSVFVLPYSTIVNITIANSIFILMYFFGISYVFLCFSTFVLYCVFMKIVADHFSTIIRPKSTNTEK